MLNNNPSSSWLDFSTFLDQAIQQNTATQPGSMATWEEGFESGEPRTRYGVPESQMPAPISPMQGFPQFGGDGGQTNPLHQQVLDMSQNPAMAIFNEIGQGSRYQQLRREQRGRSFNHFGSYGNPRQQLR